MPRSVAILVHDFPLGGTERIAMRLAGAWAAAGIRVVVLCGDPHGPLLPLVPPAVRLIALEPPVSRGRRSRERLGLAAAAWLRTYPVDAVFVIGNWHWETVPALAAIAAPKRPRIVVQVSSPLAMPQRGIVAQWRFERRMRRLLAGADRVVAMDDGGARDADRILRRRIATAIPLPAADDDAPPPAPPPDAPRIVAAGRLIRQKGFDLLIEAMRMLPDETRLTIVGSGPDRPVLERLVRRRKLGARITFAGFAPGIRPYLDAARLLVLPSRFEGYGAVIVEALAAGRPVVATRTTPAVHDLLGDPARGRIVPPGDVPALADAIAATLAAPPPAPQRLAEAVADYRLGPVAGRYAHLLFG